MTEAEWEAWDDAESLLEWGPGKLSARKLRLFACACCRWQGHLLRDPRTLRAVEVAERFADGEATRKELAAARARAPARDPDPQAERVAMAAINAAAPAARSAATRAASWTAMAAWPLKEVPPVFTSPSVLKWDGREQADLLRHIAGSPFRKLVAPPTWSPDVTRLAAALYAGEECSYALHDALVEAGQTELAGHFQEKEHPKGCWALDLILHKK